MAPELAGHGLISGIRLRTARVTAPITSERSGDGSLDMASPTLDLHSTAHDLLQRVAHRVHLHGREYLALTLALAVCGSALGA